MCSIILCLSIPGDHDLPLSLWGSINTNMKISIYHQSTPCSCCWSWVWMVLSYMLLGDKNQRRTPLSRGTEFIAIKGNENWPNRHGKGREGKYTQVPLECNPSGNLCQTSHCKYWHIVANITQIFYICKMKSHPIECQPTFASSSCIHKKPINFNDLTRVRKA